MTYDEYRKEMKKLGWNDDDVDYYIERFEKLINTSLKYKEELKLEYFLREPPELSEPPILYTASFSDEVMEKYWK